MHENIQLISDVHLEKCHVPRDRFVLKQSPECLMTSAYYCPESKKMSIEKEAVQEIIAEKISNQAQRELPASIVHAMKKNGSPRFRVDYRTRNAVVVHDSYPLVLIHDCIDYLRDMTVVLSPEPGSGY